ncbi:PDZ domain-containing protein [Caulobacter sp. UNC279MFTsu5.1]|uniref:PDZ domain-containing protein n=1 Tax=Caulobacter sp. UNC279MFTsu5.1 TaxID=1502775 RepID=UPI000B7DDAC6|nr:PDZ domain-containing protein [Caulobacter sp. UNC279MFTsu5.1]
MDDFGVRPKRLRRRAEQPAFPPPLGDRAQGAAAEERSFAGMRLKSVTTPGEQSAAGLPEIAGVMVLSVDKDGPAARAAFKPGDVVIDLPGDAGDTTQAINTLEELLAEFKSRRWRYEISVRVMRNQAEMDLRLTLPQ